MDMFLAALGILAATAGTTALLSLLPRSGDTLLARLARQGISLGPVGIMLGCLVGLAAAISGPWNEALFHTLSFWALPFGHGLLGLDALSRVFLLPVFGLGCICAFSGMMSMRQYLPGEHNINAHWCFFCLLLFSLALVCTARDAVLFLLAWEVMSVSPFFLIEFHDEDATVREASWIYLVAAHLGAVFLLAFFGLLWGTAGDTAFSAFALVPTTGTAALLFVLGLVGFGAKAGLTPLHVWLPEAHPAAPSHVSALLSGAMINAGLYGMMRMLDFFTPLHTAPGWWGWLLLGLGLITGLTGILKAMAQANLKRLLAYSSVENMGIMLMGLGTGLVGLHSGNTWITLLGFCGTLLHMCNHAAFKGLLFLCAGEILHLVHSVRLEHLGGLQKRMPLVGVAFAVGAASIACMPPFNGFAGEFLLALALGNGLALSGTEAPLALLAALAGLALISGFAAVTFIKAYGITFLGEPRSGAAKGAAAPGTLEILPLLPLILACVGLGLGATWLLPLLSAALPLAAAPLPAQVTQASDLLWRVALLGLGGAMLTGAIVAARRWMLRGKKAPGRAPTWGCGFQAGTPRIQYTGASYAQPTARVFGAAMGLKVRLGMDKKYFPTRASLEISAPDRMRTALFAPLFEAVVRACDALKIIQHGRVHLYILYMLVTLVALLVWGLHA